MGQENEDAQTAGASKDNHEYVTIQTKEVRSRDALRAIDNANNFKRHKRLSLKRYSIAGTPRLMGKSSNST